MTANETNAAADSLEKRYKSDEYLEDNPTWHVEDSPWKASQVRKMLDRNNLKLDRIGEIGCGAGEILNQLQLGDSDSPTTYTGYDIAPQAIDRARQINNPKLNFENLDLLSDQNKDFFDLLLVIDVFEHVPDYMGFIDKCRAKATYKMYHIPLEMNVSTTLRKKVTQNRYTFGHLHYYNFESAIGTLEDTGHEVVDYFYTSNGLDLFKVRPTFKRALINVPRWMLSQLSVPFTCRMIGGYSLMVLAK